MAVIQQILGIGALSINWYQAAVRTIIMYIATIAMVRIGEKRFLGKNTAFDIIVGFILGSLISGAIVIPDTLLPTIVAGFVLVGLHWLFAAITFRWNTLDGFLKGTSHKLVENGRILWDAMDKNRLTREDLIEEMRAGAETEDLDAIKDAYFERSGDISFIKYNRQPVILEVKVEKGVQTVRIVLEPNQEEKHPG